MFERHHLHRPAVGRGAGSCVVARISRQLILNQIGVEVRARREARTRRAGRVADAVAVDHVTGRGRRDVAARDRTGVARGTCLGIDGVRLIYARIFGKIKFNPGGVR